MYGPKKIVKISPQSLRHEPVGKHRHRCEHWHIDNQIYFITARCRDRLPAFRTEAAKAIFWQQLDIKAQAHGFTPIITSLIDNHYHVLGHLREGEQLTPLIRGLHSSVARYINQVTPEAEQVKPLFRMQTGKQYFDGAIRSSKQFIRTFRYIERQGIWHKLCQPGEAYAHTRISVERDRAMKRALRIGAFLYGVDDRKRAV